MDDERAWLYGSGGDRVVDGLVDQEVSGACGTGVREMAWVPKALQEPCPVIRANLPGMDTHK